MTVYVLTFTQSAVGLKDGWVEVVAPDETAARRWARQTYGDLWSGIYPDGEHGPEFYPHGRLGSITLSSQF